MDKAPLIPENKGTTDAPPAAPPPYAPGPSAGYPPPAAATVPPPGYGGTYGQQQHNTVVVVEQQGTAIPAVRPAIVLVPPDYTALAMVAVVFFFPLGLVALSLAKRSRESVRRGDMQSAYSEAVMSRILSRISLSIGMLLVTVIILSIVLPTTIY